MSKGVSEVVTYKDYHQNDQWLFPPTFSDFIPKDHFVRVVSKTIDDLHLYNHFLKKMKGGGASRYNPIMLLKVITYCYMSGIYSSRQIAKQCRENINVMWLSAMQKPDFRTINRFRNGVLKDTIEVIFIDLVKLLYNKGYISLENYFLDGTKIESAANKYTFVWKKATDTNDAKLDEKLKVIIKDIEALTEKENEQYGDKDFSEEGDTTVTSADIIEVAQKIDDKIKELDNKEDKESKELKKQLTKTAKLIDKDYLPRKLKYEEYKSKFKGRNSFSKTDEDATFMRMKEDHMLNGQLKPGYNLQVGTENCFVLGYDVFPNPTDTRTFIPHLNNVMERLNCTFKTVIADAGYGSEENYDYLKEKGITGAVKYTSYEKEKKRSFKKKIYNAENWQYDKEQQQYTCPNGNPVPYVKTILKKNASGYEQEIKIFQCENCEGCPCRDLCTKSYKGRMVQRNENWLAQKTEVKELLETKEYKALMRRRSVECETVFGQIKSNQHFRRFLLRGNEKIGTEWGILMVGYNLKQIARLQRIEDEKKKEKMVIYGK